MNQLVYSLTLAIAFLSTAPTFADTQNNLELNCTSRDHATQVQAWIAHDFDWQMIQVKSKSHAETFINGAMDDFYRFNSIDAAKSYPLGYQVAGMQSDDSVPKITVPGGDQELPLLDLKGLLYQVNHQDGQPYGTFAAVLKRRDPANSEKILKPIFLKCTSQYKTLPVPTKDDQAAPSHKFVN
jgi:hypothetical protein